MSSTILPDGRNAFLPKAPRDGQSYVDAAGNRWLWLAASGAWTSVGATTATPAASAAATGFLSARDKAMLDRIPEAGGAFGFIVDPKTVAKTADNPDGVIQGDVRFVSDSLDVACVDGAAQRLACLRPPLTECDASGGGRPGLSFRINDRFLETFRIDLRGPKGQKGAVGDVGPQGDPGFSDGPEGETGDPGDDATFRCEFLGFEYEDLPGVTDVAVAAIAMTADCKIIITRAPVTIDDGRAADQLQATAASRSVTYAEQPDLATCRRVTLDDWQLTKAPQDATPLDLQLVRLPKGAADAETTLGATTPLSAWVADVVAHWRGELERADADWQNEVRDYVNGVDREARLQLASLSGQLAECEFGMPAYEYCALVDACDAPADPAPALPDPPLINVPPL